MSNNTHPLTWEKKSVAQMSPLMIMSVYGPGKDTHTQAHIVSLDPCRIRSCLEQSWLQPGTQPELPQHQRKRAGGRENRTNGKSRDVSFLLPYTFLAFVS